MVLLKHGFVYCRLRNYGRAHIDDPPTLNYVLYLLSTLYVTRDKIFQALYSFSVLQATESWAGPGNETSYLCV